MKKIIALSLPVMMGISPIISMESEFPEESAAQPVMGIELPPTPPMVQECLNIASEIKKLYANIRVKIDPQDSQPGNSLLPRFDQPELIDMYKSIFLNDTTTNHESAINTKNAYLTGMIRQFRKIFRNGVQMPPLCLLTMAYLQNMYDMPNGNGMGFNREKFIENYQNNPGNQDISTPSIENIPGSPLLFHFSQSKNHVKKYDVTLYSVLNGILEGIPGIFELIDLCVKQELIDQRDAPDEKIGVKIGLEAIQENLKFALELLDNPSLDPHLLMSNKIYVSEKFISDLRKVCALDKTVPNVNENVELASVDIEKIATLKQYTKDKPALEHIYYASNEKIAAALKKIGQ